MYIKNIYYKKSAHLNMEAEKSQAGDPGGQWCGSILSQSKGLRTRRVYVVSSSPRA